MTAPLDEAEIRQAKDIATQVLDCVDREGEWLDEARAVELIAAALDQVRREEYRRGQDEEAAKHADCCVDREELDQVRRERDALRLRVETLEAALREIMEGKGAYSLDPLTHASNAIDDMKALARAALTSDAGRGESAASV